MPKTRELPFYGSYGFEGDTPFRYFFLKEDSQNLEEYKKAILKCLKYDILYEIIPDHQSGHETYDALRPQVTLPVELPGHKFGRVFHESVRGTQSGEIVVTYKVSDDRKSLELTLYDRDTILQPIRTSDDDDAPLQYALVDKIIESKVTITKGKKLSTKDVYVYQKPQKYLGEQPHSYDDSIKVIKSVKEKAKYPIEDPRDLITDEPKKEKEENKGKNKRG